MMCAKKKKRTFSIISWKNLKEEGSRKFELISRAVGRLGDAEMAHDSNISTPSKLTNATSSPRLGGGISAAPSLLSLRSVIDFMPNDIRRRYKDTAKYTIWPECPLDGNGNAVEIDKSRASSSLLGSKLKRNFTMSTDLVSREYSKFGNDPVMVPTNLKPPRNRQQNEATPSGFHAFTTPLRQRKPVKPPSIAYFSSKDGGDVSVKILSKQMTRL